MRTTPIVTLLLVLLSMPAQALAAMEEEHHHAPAGESNESPDPMVAMDAMEPMNHWMTMIHGYAFLTFNRQGGPSGDRAFESENHFMLMAMRRWGGGKLSLLGTFTLEPATIPPGGYPLLFQRGETYKGDLLVDRQHQHDLFIQLAARWDRPLSERTSFGVYLAPEGEPAVGPTAYPHRLSASVNPMSPLAHHNQDSTHLSADVVTLSLAVPRVTFEASAFHGAEPDERRWNLDQGAIDSYAGRLTIKPGAGFSFQVSAARRKDPEELEPGDQTRQTASVEYMKKTDDGFLAATLILGRNLLDEGTEWGNGLEATWKFRRKNFIYGRVESVDRDLVELITKQQRPASVPPERTTVQTATAGFVRNVPLGIFRDGVETGLGGAVTFYRFESALDDTYGDVPVSAQLFLKVGFSGGGMDHSSMHH
jgi:hypothetical protein